VRYKIDFDRSILVCRTQDHEYSGVLDGFIKFSD